MLRSKMQKNFFKTFLLLAIFFIVPHFAKAADPTTEPVLQQSNLEYVGAFRIPISDMANGAMAFRPAKGNAPDGSLYMQGEYYTGEAPLTAEIKIPAIVNAWNKTLLNTAEAPLQNLTDTTNGNRLNIGTGGSAVPDTWNPRQAGYLVYDNKLIGALVSDYNATVLTHYVANLDWGGGIGFSGFYKVGAPVDGGVSSSGFVGGYMGTIPSEWQSAFGKPAVTGLVATSIASRTSWGPALFAFDPDQLGGVYGSEANPTPATPLVYYDANHPTSTYSSADKVNSVVFPSGSNSVLFFGMKGMSGECYGDGTPNYAEINNQPGDSCDGEIIYPGNSCCYDPNSSSHGDHGYPYVPWVWAYRASDLLDVKNGTKNPWDISPYATWQLELPSGFPPLNITAASYDSATQRIYLSGKGSDKGNSSENPLIYVLHVNLSGGAPQTVFSEAMQVIPTPSLLNSTNITLACQGSGTNCSVQYKWDNQSSFSNYTGPIPAQYGILYAKSTDSNGQGPLEYRAYASSNFPVTINDTLSGSILPNAPIYLTCFGQGLYANCTTAYAWDNDGYSGGSTPAIQAIAPASVGTHVLHYISSDSTGTSPIQSVTYVVGNDTTAPAAPSGLSVQ